jgi:hypothetical protein
MTAKEWEKTHVRNGHVNNTECTRAPNTLSPTGRCSWGEAPQAPP